MVRNLTFRVLGALDVLVGDESIVPTSSRQRDLLALLLLDANTVVSSDRLVDRLWQGEPPATAAAALQVYVAKLRALIDGCPTAGITTVSSGYRFDVEPPTIDSYQFEELSRRGHNAFGDGLARTAVEALRPAMELWRGEALADVRHLEGVRIEVARLEETRLQALGTLLDAELALGHHLGMIPELERLVESDPLQERRWGQLMLALYRAGRQSDALRAYRRATDVLGEEMGIEPGPDLYNLEERILLQDPTLTLVADDTNPRTNLERSVSSFVGRETELGRLAELLAMRPLVTLTGPGGAGKTRLAREVGWRVLDAYTDGVWFVDLSSVRHGSQVPYRVAEALGATEQPGIAIVDVIARYLRHRSCLLVLDNCEHVLEAAADLAATILADGPLLTILATSRQRLAIEGETTWTVPPLVFPAQGSTEVGSGEHEAVDLFIERARLVRPDFELAESNARHIAGICRRLDGLPLAIELAAARVDVLSVAEIEHRLMDDLSLLKRQSRFQPLRHATLAAAMRWSYELLVDAERYLFERLSVFAGGFLLVDVEAICANERLPGPQIFDVLARLVEKSLVVVRPQDQRGTRYAMLETVRGFAAGAMAASGDPDAMSRRHAEHFLVLAEDAARELQGAHQQEWLDRLDADHDNLRLAFDWFLANEHVEEALRMGASLRWFWKMHDNIAEGVARLDSALAGAGEVSPAVRAEATMAAGVLKTSSDVDDAYALLEESRELAIVAGDVLCEGLALGWMGLLDRIRGEMQTSLHHLTDALSRVEGAGEDWAIAFVLGHLGILSRERGRLPEAADYHDRALMISRKIGNAQDEAWNVAALGIVNIYEGDNERARPLLQSSYNVQRSLGFDFESATALVLLGIASARSDDPDGASSFLAKAQQRARKLNSARLLEAVYRARATVANCRGEEKRAAQLLGAAHRFREDNGLARSMFQALFDADERQIRSALSAKDFSSAWESGYQAKASEAAAL